MALDAKRLEENAAILRGMTDGQLGQLLFESLGSGQLDGDFLVANEFVDGAFQYFLLRPRVDIEALMLERTKGPSVTE